MNQTRQTNGGLALPALLLTLLLCVAQTKSRPSTENEADITALPPDADNVELHHVKLVNGIMTEDHPIVMYKEDFVNEDYDPIKNETKKTHTRKYEHVKRLRHHHSHPTVEKQQEKIRFDVLPETPIFNEDVEDVDSDAYNFKAASLLEPSKAETQQKYPKKYHSRQRRQAFYSSQGLSYKYHPYQSNVAPGNYYLPSELPRQYQRYPISGKKPVYKGPLPTWQKPTTGPVSIGNRDNFEDESNSLFHNSNPDDADFSVFDRPRPEVAASQSGAAGSSNSWQSTPINGWQSPPEEEQERRPVWGPSAGRRPVNSGGFNTPTTSAPTFNTRPVRTTTTRRPRPDASKTTPKVSNCVWAIVNCCSQDNNRIRYSCFEEFGCHGAFWDVNPCADNIRDGAIASITRSFSSGPASLRQK